MEMSYHVGIVNTIPIPATRQLRRVSPQQHPEAMILMEGAAEANDPFLKLLASLLDRADRGELLDLERLIIEHAEHAAALKEYFSGDLALCAALCLPLAPTVSRTNSDSLAESTPLPPLPARIGDYEILERIARGGMGIVYKARQLSLNRIVALKLVLLGDLAEPDSLDRFRAEAQLMAQVHHKDIVTIYEVGEADGNPYLSMELVDGPSLRQVIREHPLNPLQAAEQMSVVAEAVHFAHSREILHRDLKPSNIFVRASGRPCVGDFGIAKRLRSASDLTFTGQVLGTPSYMSPEQTCGLAGEVGISSDVYSLGAILYELLVGRPPFRAETAVETLRQVQEHEPVSPRALNPAVPHDLETICLKCLQKEPAKRYATALAFSQDLQRFREGRPVMALPVSRWQHLWRWCRRNRMVASLLAGVVTLTIGLVVGLVYFLQSSRALQRAAEASARRATEMLFLADLQLAGTAYNANDPREASTVLARCAELDPDWTLRDFTWHYLKDQVSNRGQLLGTHNESFWHATYSRDGRSLATCGSAGVIRIYDTANFSSVREIPAGQSELNCVDFSPDGRLLASAGDDGRVKIWDLSTGRTIHEISALKERVFYAKFFPDGERIAICGLNPEISIWSTTTGERLATLTGVHSEGVEAIAISPDGHWLASAGADRLAVIWDTTTHKPHFEPQPHASRLTCVAITADSQRFLFGGVNGSAVAWKLSGERLFELQRPDALLAMAIAPDGQVACSDQGGAISLWNMPSMGMPQPQPERQWLGHGERINGLAFAPAGHSLVSAARDGTVRLWSIEKQSAVRRLAGPGMHRPQTCGAIALSAEPRYFYRSGPWGVERWDVEANFPARLMVSDREVFACDTLGKMLICADFRGHIGMFSDENDAAPRWKHVFEKGLVDAIKIFPQGDRVAVMNDDHELRILSIPDLKVLAHRSDCATLSVAPDGKWIAIGKHVSNDLEILSPTLELIQTCKLHHSTIQGVEISPDGENVVSIGDDRRAIVWGRTAGEPEQWGLRHSLASHPHALHCAAWSPDGRTLTTADERGIIRFWHAGSGRKLLELAVSDNVPREMHFTRDGLHLVISSRPFQLLVLDAPHERIDGAAR